MTTPTNNLWDFLETENPHTEHTNRLFQWGLNYDNRNSPWMLFLDIIGYSQEQYGSNLHKGEYAASIGFLEADYLGRALIEWSDRTQQVEEWITELLSKED